MKHPGLKELTSDQSATRAFLARLQHSFFVIWLYRSKCAGKFCWEILRDLYPTGKFWLTLTFSLTETVFSLRWHSMQVVKRQTNALWRFTIAIRAPDRRYHYDCVRIWNAPQSFAKLELEIKFLPREFKKFLQGKVDGTIASHIFHIEHIRLTQC